MNERTFKNKYIVYLIHINITYVCVHLYTYVYIHIHIFLNPGCPIGQVRSHWPWDGDSHLPARNFNLRIECKILVLMSAVGLDPSTSERLKRLGLLRSGWGQDKPTCGWVMKGLESQVATDCELESDGGSWGKECFYLSQGCSSARYCP